MAPLRELNDKKKLLLIAYVHQLTKKTFIIIILVSDYQSLKINNIMIRYLSLIKYFDYFQLSVHDIVLNVPRLHVSTLCTLIVNLPNFSLNGFYLENTYQLSHARPIT